MSVLDESEALLNELVSRVRADFEVVLPGLELQFTTYREWMSDTPASRRLETKLPMLDDVVCITDRGSFPLRVHEGVEVSCFIVATQLQDAVMDDLQRPWPAFEVQGSLIVPIPELDELGRACWQADDRFRCPVGYLRSALTLFAAID